MPDANDNPAGDLRPNFLGRVQPYAVYVPTGAASGPRPLTWLLHSLGVQHNQYGALNPKFLQQACERRGSICATTLGRGPDGWYFDEAEVDFWEAWHALSTGFALDPERTVLSGYSMGGWATYKLGLAYPDLFAKAVVMAGPPVCGIRVTGDVVQPAGPGRCTDDGTSVPLLANARWLPYFIAHGAADQLVPVTGVVEHVADIDGLGLRHRFELYPALDHLAWAAADLFASPAAHMGAGKRTRDPGRITYTWFPHLQATGARHRPDRRLLGAGPAGPQRRARRARLDRRHLRGPTRPGGHPGADVRSGAHGGHAPRRRHVLGAGVAARLPARAAAADHRPAGRRGGAQLHARPGGHRAGPDRHHLGADRRSDHARADRAGRRVSGSGSAVAA